MWRATTHATSQLVVLALNQILLSKDRELSTNVTFFLWVTHLFNFTIWNGHNFWIGKECVNFISTLIQRKKIENNFWKLSMHDSHSAVTSRDSHVHYQDQEWSVCSVMVLPIAWRDWEKVSTLIGGLWFESARSGELWVAASCKLKAVLNDYLKIYKQLKDT